MQISTATRSAVVSDRLRKTVTIVLVKTQHCTCSASILERLAEDVHDSLAPFWVMMQHRGFPGKEDLYARLARAERVEVVENSERAFVFTGAPWVIQEVSQFLAYAWERYRVDPEFINGPWHYLNPMFIRRGYPAHQDCHKDRLMAGCVLFLRLVKANQLAHPAMLRKVSR